MALETSLRHQFHGQIFQVGMASTARWGVGHHGEKDIYRLIVYACNTWLIRSYISVIKIFPRSFFLADCFSFLEMA